MMNDEEELIHIPKYTMKKFDVVNDYVHNTLYMMDSE